jgi:uncharacterized membrane protein YdbT with pleckstrin-like domain
MLANPRFYSKVDTWLAVVLGILVLTAVAVPIALYAMGDAYAWAGLVGAAFILLILVGLVFPVYYELADDALVIRSGLVRSNIRYSDIRRVVPTRSMLSNPALSLDRLHVDTGNPLGPLISPKDKRAFLDALAVRAPHLIRQGDQLVPRAGGNVTTAGVIVST